MTDAPATAMTEHNVAITRDFDAPRDLLWTCWTDPEHFAAWWGPEHFTTPIDSVVIDLRPGGAFKATMVGPDGTEYPGDGTFEEITPKDRLVLLFEETDHPMMESQRTVVSFTDLGDGRSRVDIDATIVCVDEFMPMVQSGWNSTFDKLALVLTQG